MSRRLLLALLGVLLAVASVEAGRKVNVPLERLPAIDLSAHQHVGIVQFEGQDSRFLLEMQFSGYIEKRFRQSGSFESVRLVPLTVFREALGASTATDADGNLTLRDEAFWQRVGSELAVDLLVYGSYEYTSQYRPGYVQERLVDERTGLMYFRDVYKEMVGYRLMLTVELRDTASGRAVTSWQESTESVMQDQASPTSSGFLRLMRRLYEPLHEQMFPPPLPKRFVLLP